MLEWVLRVALVAVLAGAAAAKLADPRAARDGLVAFGFRSPAASAVGFWLLVGVEAGLAVGLVAGLESVAWLGSAVMLAFALALSGAISAGRAGELCACFGPRSRIGWPAVLRTLALAGAFLAVALLSS